MAEKKAAATAAPLRSGARAGPAPPSLQKYDAKHAVAPFRLQNNGAICHFNSLLQALVSCPSLVAAAQGSAAYLEQTQTGSAFRHFVLAAARGEAGVEKESAALLSALVGDLRVRRPLFKVAFGASQESASEGLVMLLDMLEPPDSGRPRPITDLFEYRAQCSVKCKKCEVVATTKEFGVQINLFDNYATPPKTSEEFSKLIWVRTQEVSDFKCPACKASDTRNRLYRIGLLSEIIVCGFNIYGERRPRFVPETLSFPAATGPAPGPAKTAPVLRYRRVAMIEHSGSLEGGHYTAYCLRRDNRVFCFNDAAAPTPASFSGSDGNKNIYLVFYHYVGVEEPSVATATTGTGAAAGAAVLLGDTTRPDSAAPPGGAPPSAT